MNLASSARLLRLRKLLPARTRLSLEVEMNRLLAKGSRIVEYPFVIGNIGIGRPCRVMVFGSFNDLTAVELASLGFQVVCFDIVGNSFVHPNIKFIKGDFLVTSAEFPDGSFDAAVAVSSIEHAGLELNSGRHIRDGDRQVVKRINRLLRAGERLILTLPYGRAGEYPAVNPSFRKYDTRALAELLADFESYDCRRFVSDHESHWLPADPEDLGLDASNASTSVVCVVAKKRA